MAVPGESYLQESSFDDPLPTKQCDRCGMNKLLSPENFIRINDMIFRSTCKVCFNKYGRRLYRQPQRVYAYVTPQILNSNPTP